MEPQINLFNPKDKALSTVYHNVEHHTALGNTGAQKEYLYRLITFSETLVMKYFLYVMQMLTVSLI
ncbi:MAG TPA: hypothetical protein VI278_15125 [Nitrososphaeraceae archaeon]